MIPRKMLPNSYSQIARICAVIAAVIQTSFAASLVVDPTQSTITLSGKVATYTLSEQGAGSLTTTVGGTMDVAATASEVQITSASLDPNVNGNWAPGRDGQPTAPADLAGSAQTLFGGVVGALRNLLVTARSEPKTIQSNGTFDAGSIIFAFPTNSSSVFEYDSFIAKGSKVLSSVGTNNTATVGSWIDSSGVQTLTLALNATFYFSLIGDNDTQLTLIGQIVAKSAGPGDPKLGGFEFVDGQMRFNLSGGSETSGIEGTTNLVNWVPVQASAVAGQNGERNFTVPTTGPMTFFRAKL